MSLKVEILRYIMITKGSTLAKATIKVPEWGNIIIEGVVLFLKGSSKWTGLPSRKDEEGKYWPWIKFEKREEKTAFDHAVFEALDDKIAKGKSSESYPDCPDFL